MKTDNKKSKLTPSNLKLSAAIKSKMLKNGLRLDYFEKPTSEKIKVSDILSPEAFSRIDPNDEYGDFENVENIDPIILAILEGSQGYSILDGQRRLQYLKNQKEAKIEASIVGEAVCHSQLAMTRAAEMTKLKKPLNILELIHGLLELRQVIIEEFGEDHFFKHGGSDRKQNPNSKESLSAFIARCTGLKQTSVAALLNFGLQIGVEGLQGLQTFDDMKTLAIRKINRINVSLKKSKLKEEIEKLTSTVGSNGGKKPELIKAVGKLAYQTINGQASKGEFDLEDLKHEITGHTASLNLIPKGKGKPKMPKNPKKDPDDGNPKSTPFASEKDLAKLLSSSERNIQEFIKKYSDYNNGNKKVERDLRSIWENFNSNLTDITLILVQKFDWVN